MLTKTDFRSVTGTQKAAMLMLSLGEDHAMRIFTMLDEDEIKELSQSMANLGSVDADMVERLFVEFTEKISATGSLGIVHQAGNISVGLLAAILRRRSEAAP